MFKANCQPAKQPVASRLWSLWAIALLLSLFIPGCTALKPATTQAPVDLVRVFPAANFIPGWEVSQKGETYDRDNLFNLVDGQADLFFAYGFEKVAVQRYQNEARRSAQRGNLAAGHPRRCVWAVQRRAERVTGSHRQRGGFRPRAAAGVLAKPLLRQPEREPARAG